MVTSSIINIQSKKELDIIDITDRIQREINKSGVKNGIVTVFAQGATGAVTTIEYEDGLLKDFADGMERIAPKDIDYEHHKKWHDDNGRSHVRASVLGPSLTVPFTDRKLTLGTWQQVVFVELDTRPRQRSLIIQIVGE